MMLKREPTPRVGSRLGSRTRGNRAGSSVFAVLAGAAMVCTGATAAVLAGSHATAVASTSSQCRQLPAAPTSPAPSPSQTATAGSNGSTVPVSSTPNATPTDLCVTVAAQASAMDSGQNAYYSITVNPKGNTADNVTVQISSFASKSSPAVPAPAFTVCGNGDGSAVCTLGTMHAGQTTQLQAKIAIPSSAPSGDTITLSAKVSGAAPGASSTGSVTGSASTSAIAPSPTPTKTHTSSPSPSPSNTSGSGHHHSGGSGNNSGSGNGNGSGTGGFPGTTGNTYPLAGLPPLTTSGTSPLGSLGSLSSSNPGGLFPTISPSSGTTPSTATTGNKSHDPYKATTVADVLPLNTGQLSTQVAGLIVLALGIVLVFARVTLRKPKDSESKS
jgi:hypothetical protein